MNSKDCSHELSDKTLNWARRRQVMFSELRVVALKNNGIVDYYADKISFPDEALLGLGAFSQVYIGKLEVFFK